MRGGRLDPGANTAAGIVPGVMTEEFSSPSEGRVREVVLALAATTGYDGEPPGQDEALTVIGFDSLLTIELVARLEDEFGIEIPDECLTPASFDTLRAVVAVVDTFR